MKLPSDEMSRVLRSCRGYLIAAALFSGCINLLYLAAPLYMLQVYDRVVPSGSRVTLVMITIMVVIAFLALAALDAVRARVLTRASVRLDRLLANRILGATMRGPIGTRGQGLRDFDTFRQAITGAGIHALLDLPWTPIYVAVIFLLHPWLGLFALGSVAVLGSMALANEWLVRRPLGLANAAAATSYSFTEMSRRNAEVIRAMGMIDGLAGRWDRDRDRFIACQTVASDRAALIQSAIRFLRLTLQSAILGLGAYLVIDNMATGGAMFAASILLARALQPVDQLSASWRNLVAGRDAFFRVCDMLAANPRQDAVLALPRPEGSLAVEQVSYLMPGGSRPLLRNVDFRLAPGEFLGLVGPSGAGKSTLARHLVGVTRPSQGTVRLDGADIAAWPASALGPHIGYLPQDIELFADSVAANIGRFGQGSDAEVVEAARLAGVHEMILRLPQGYETEIGGDGTVLSGGVRQRLALARAVLGRPSLIVLDEPNSNLDSEGDRALADCLAELKRRGTTVIVISHRLASLSIVDKMLVLRDGAVEAFGERAEVIARSVRQVSLAPARIDPAEAAGGAR